ncbi:kazrin isoform X2 [Eupeodes corollae]|uniref:kazrin isoform X2 n=1 Tax=Eupeodes corollae TaxID=290404 RepID=UPI0024906BEC|nr:kazrin isoform X2 [Eupeodes corollae]
MQINGTTGPTMAASEPPEPPPRNPDRINASLNKFTDTKTTKSLDTNDKPVNNNKPLKPLLSLDNTLATSPSTSLSSSSATNSSGSLTTTASGGLGSVHSPSSGHIFNKRMEINSQGSSNNGGGGGNGCAPPGSNSSPGSNGIRNLILTSPLCDNIHQRSVNLNKSESNNHLLQFGGAGAGGGAGGPGGSGGGGIDGGQIDMMNGTNHAAMTTVDKKNANDVVVKFMDLGLSGTGAQGVNGCSLFSTKDQHLNNMDKGASGGGGGGSSNSSSCDGNRNDDSKFQFNEAKDSPSKLRIENERLNSEIQRLRKLLENSPDGAVGGIDLSDSNSCDAHSTDGGGSSSRIDRLEAELKAAKTQITALRLERKKLKTDKTDLLAHVKQLCASLQDKEQELRDFIRNYEQRIRESETNNAKMSSDRERERWSLLKHARDEAERSLALAQQLSARDVQLQRLQEQLQEARRQLSGCLSDQESLLSFAPLTPPSGLINHLAASSANSNALAAYGTTGGGGGGGSIAGGSSIGGGGGGSAGGGSGDSGVRGSSDRESAAGDLNLSDGTCENGPCITVDPDSISIVSSQNMYQFGTPKERSPTLSPLNSAAYSRSVEQLGSPGDNECPSALTRKFAAGKPGALNSRNGRGGTWGSISRVFARSRNKSKALSADTASEYSDYSWNSLTEEGYAEKLRLLREASQVPMERWRASQVLAWLEVALGMPQYSTRCSENVKSGKVLLELNDAELETGLGLAHPMHKKKLRLAIEEQRRPELVRYPLITQLGHTWVASEWLPDIGLPQYTESFLHSLVDARMLDTLSKKELEKFLGVTRKFHQASIVHGIHVLRIVKYDRQTLAMRRVQSESVDTDPIVWTNQRFIRWARSIDLGEYADNLKDSGVHGGLVVLEPSFSGDTMATALGIPPSKNIIRRHLATEFDALILPARATLGQGIRSGCGIVPITGPGGLQHYATADRRSSGSLRSSLSKAFRFNAKARGERSFGNSTSPTPSYSSSEGGGGIYATIGPPLLPPPTTAPPPPPPSHRVSAPPAASQSSDPTLVMAYGQHRRVKSISDIEVMAASPV